MHLFSDSHFCLEPARILLLGILVHPVKIMVGIIHQFLWPIFVLGHDLLSITCIGFLTLIRECKQTRILVHGILMHPIKTLLAIAHHLPWPIFDLGHDLLSFSHIGFWILYSCVEPARILIFGTLMHPISMLLLGIAHWLRWPIFDLGHDLISIRMELIRILLPGKLVHPIINLLGIVHQFLDLYLTSVMTYFLSVTLAFGLSFLKWTN